MGLLPVDTEFREEKTRSQVKGVFGQVGGVLSPLSGLPAEGYQIHMGVTEKRGSPPGLAQAGEEDGKWMPEGTWQGSCYGTYIHGILDGEGVAAGVAAIHSETASVLKYNDENSLTCTILMAYYSAKAYYLNPIMEMPSGKGYADVVYLPKRNVNKPALVVELKWNKSAEGAIAQIKRKQYAAWIKGYTGDILLVGISYDKNKTHQCLIEKCVKSGADLTGTEYQ